MLASPAAASTPPCTLLSRALAQSRPKINKLLEAGPNSTPLPSRATLPYPPLLLLLLATLLSLACFLPRANASVVKVLIKPLSELSALDELNTLMLLVQKFEAETGIDIQLTIPPDSFEASDFLSYIAPYLAGEQNGFDIVSLDEAWLPQYSDSLVDLFSFGAKDNDSPLAKNISRRVADQQLVFQHLDFYDNRLLALPFFADYGALFYRNDLVGKVPSFKPKTWDDLEEICNKVIPIQTQNNSEFSCYAAALGDVSATLDLEASRIVPEWFKTGSGSDLFGTHYQVIFNTSQNALIMDRFRKWIATGIFSADSLAWTYTTARIQWETGNALFWHGRVRNIAQWGPLNNLWNGSRPIWGALNLPHDKLGHAASAVDSYHLAIIRNGPNPNLSDVARALLFLTSETVQEHRTLKHGVPPTIKKLYDPSSRICNATNETIQSSGFIFPCTLINEFVPLQPYARVAQFTIPLSTSLSGHFINILNGSIAAEPGLHAAALSAIAIFNAQNGTSQDGGGFSGTPRILVFTLVPLAAIVASVGAVLAVSRRRADHSPSGPRLNRFVHFHTFSPPPGPPPLALIAPLGNSKSPVYGRARIRSGISSYNSSRSTVYDSEIQASHRFSDQKSYSDSLDRPPTIPREPRFFVAVHPYRPRMGDEVEIWPGDRVIVRKAYDDGYALGHIQPGKSAPAGAKPADGVFPLACLVLPGLKVDFPSRLESGAGVETEDASEQVDSLEMLLLYGRITESTYLDLRREQEEELRTQRQMTALRDRLEDDDLDPAERELLERRLDELEYGA
ncbi:hypothetical protein BDK51DRAFT_26490 [Blyttiomyces helicus]|uniref:SH3 domain-containing protein n=1 Tax=Blyttiomyces helicus TaxID=388810 RepID=A0A4P9W382_9FUNG|nr:hypothetical protein BDK51DRAFT_26490 [Blyttiomyces helicus]|eukprot:RKO86751.1 hypothetical protein BDK51DRAFT_26490 [Blyttiomyces helicus]